MIGKKIILYLALLATFLTGCGEVNKTKVTTSDLGSVEGIVTNIEDGLPLAGVTVSVGSVSATSNISGVYTISDLDVGSRTILAILNDFESFSGLVEINKNTTVTFNISMTATSITPSTQLNWDSGNWDATTWQ